MLSENAKQRLIDGLAATKKHFGDDCWPVFVEQGPRGFIDKLVESRSATGNPELAKEISANKDEAAKLIAPYFGCY